jgi:hypothetical protein
MAILNIQKETSTRFYLKPKSGVFSVSRKLPGNDTAYETFPDVNVVEGRFKSISIAHDNGTPKSAKSKGYNAYDYLRLLLIDPVTDEAYVLQCDVTRTFAYALASKLHACEKDSYVRIQAIPGRENGVTLCNVSLLEDESQLDLDASERKFVNVTGKKYLGDPEEKVKQGVEDIKSHPCFKEYPKPTK